MQITDWRPFFSPAPSIWTLTKTHPPRKHKHAKMCLSTKPVPQFKNVSYNKHESTCKKIPFHFCGPSVLSWHLCLLRRLASANGPHLRTQPVPSRDSVSLAPSEGEKLGMCYLKVLHPQLPHCRYSSVIRSSILTKRHSISEKQNLKAMWIA